MNPQRLAGCPSAILLARALRDLLREPRALLATLALPLILYPLLFLLGPALLQEAAAPGQGQAWRLGLARPLAHLEPWLSGEGLWVGPLPQGLQEELDSGRLDAALVPGSGPESLRLVLGQAPNDLRARVEAALGQWHQARLLEAPGGSTGPSRNSFLLSERALPLEAPAGTGFLTFLPLALMLVLLSGTAFAALDLLPGERERGTVETVLAQPVKPLQVLLGIFLATLICGLAALGLNLASLASLAPLLGSTEETLCLGWTTAVRLFLLAWPLAFSLTALLIWVMALARSFREGQAYLLPLTLACLVPASMGLSPALPLNGFTALVPLAGPILVCREGLAGWPDPGPLVVMSVASVLWGGLALAGAAALMSSERGRLGEDPLASLDSPQGPPGRRAVLWSVMLLFAFLVLAPPLQGMLGSAGHAAAQVGLLLLPALILPRILGLPLERAFPMRRPSWVSLGGTGLLALGAALFGMNYLALQQLWLPLPESVLSDLKRALPDLESSGLGLLLLTGAVLPALCEELLFRGPLLGAFRSHWGPAKAVLLSALLFAAMHFSVYRFMATLSTGLLFGALVLAGRSLPLACLCHFLHNGLVLSAAGGYWPAWAAPLLAGDRPDRALLVAALGALAALLGLFLVRASRQPRA